MGGRRALGGRQSEFSLGWGAAEEAQGPSGGYGRGGKRIGGAADKPTPAAYAMQLQEQIAERNAHREQNGYRAARPSMPGREMPPARDMPGPSGGANQRDPSPFARMGAAVVGQGPDPSSKAQIYADELRQQIDAKANIKAEERNRRIASEREEVARNQGEGGPAHFARQRATEQQNAMHRQIAERGDALEKFMCNRGDVAPQQQLRQQQQAPQQQQQQQRGAVGGRGQDYNANEAAGVRMGADQGARRGMPPKPKESFQLGW